MVIPGNKELSSNLDIAKRSISTRKGFLVGVLAVIGLILAACGFSPKTGTTINTFQPEPAESMPANETLAAETPFGEVTPSVETTSTQVETIPAEEKKIFLSEKIAYGGRAFDFEISTLTSDKIVIGIFEKHGVDSLIINENKPNAKELLAKTLIYTFLETYNFQNETNVSLDKFMANPENYPAMIMMKGEGGILVKQTLTIDQIKSFEFRFTTGLDRSLYMTLPGQSGLSSGYSFEKGSFIFYSGTSVKFGTVDMSIEEGYGRESEVFPYIVGLDAMSLIVNSMGMLPYTVFKLEDHKTYNDLNGKKIFGYIFDLTDTREPTLPVEELLEWFISHQLFKAVLN